VIAGLARALLSSPRMTIFALPAQVPAQMMGTAAISDWTGAYYHKVVSRRAIENTGIQGITVLPNVRTDPSRTFVHRDANGNALIDDYRTGPLDRPSIYLGGNAMGHELDCGLSWSRHHDERGRATYTDRAEGTDGGDRSRRFYKTAGGTWRDGFDREVTDRRVIDRLEPNYAFRAFWRPTNKGVKENWANAEKSDQKQYFYPGQKIGMSVFGVGRDQMQMRISAPGQQGFEQKFTAQGFGRGGAQEFKRVNAIDQFDVVNGQRVSLEKTVDRNVRKTSTTALGGSWDRVSLITRDGLVPLNSGRSTVVHGRDVHPNTFRVRSRTENGGELIDLVPQRR
jgi:hypothetical protein